MACRPVAGKRHQNGQRVPPLLCNRRINKRLFLCNARSNCQLPSNALAIHFTIYIRVYIFARECMDIFWEYSCIYKYIFWRKWDSLQQVSSEFSCGSLCSLLTEHLQLWAVKNEQLFSLKRLFPWGFDFFHFFYRTVGQLKPKWRNELNVWHISANVNLYNNLGF